MTTLYKTTLQIGPAPYVYIDIASTDSVSPLLTVKKDGVTTVQLAQNGELQICGGVVLSNEDGMQD